MPVTSPEELQEEYKKRGYIPVMSLDGLKEAYDRIGKKIGKQEFPVDVCVSHYPNLTLYSTGYRWAESLDVLMELYAELREDTTFIGLGIKESLL